MRLEMFSYRNAEEILQHSKYKMAYQEIIDVCKACPLPIYKDKSETQKKLDVLQQVLNLYFKLKFVSLGWEPEPKATPNSKEDELRADFRKTFYIQDTDEKLITVQIEVEFGNAASSYRNYFKYQLSFSFDMTDICVLIVPSQKLSTRIDSGVANYEKSVREIPSAKLSVTVPILVIGLFDEECAVWDLSTTTSIVDIFKSENSECKRLCTKVVQAYIDGKPYQMSAIEEKQVQDALSGKSESIKKLINSIESIDKKLDKLKTGRQILNSNLSTQKKDLFKFLEQQKMKNTKLLEKKIASTYKKIKSIENKIETHKEMMKEKQSLKAKLKREIEKLNA